MCWTRIPAQQLTRATASNRANSKKGPRREARPFFLGIHVAGGWRPALALIVGVWLGSLAWWIMLTGGASRVRERLTPSIIHGFGPVSGIALLGFGVITIGAALTGAGG